MRQRKKLNKKRRKLKRLKKARAKKYRKRKERANDVYFHQYIKCILISKNIFCKIKLFLITYWHLQQTSNFYSTNSFHRPLEYYFHTFLWYSLFFFFWTRSDYSSVLPPRHLFYATLLFASIFFVSDNYRITSHNLMDIFSNYISSNGHLHINLNSIKWSICQ